jgi:hypothetical protein
MERVKKNCEMYRNFGELHKSQEENYGIENSVYFSNSVLYKFSRNFLHMNFTFIVTYLVHRFEIRRSA